MTKQSHTTQEVELTPQQVQEEAQAQAEYKAVYNRTQLNVRNLSSLSLHQEAWAQRMYAQARGEVSVASIATESFLEMIGVALHGISDSRYSPQLKHRVKETITELLRLYRVDQDALQHFHEVRLVDASKGSCTTFLHVNED